MSTKRYTTMTRDELAKATADLDREFVIETFDASPPDARVRWQGVKRKPGRPRTGAGVKVISVSLEKGLLKKTDELAKAKGVSRAGLIARGLRAVISAEKPRKHRARRSARP